MEPLLTIKDLRVHFQSERGPVNALNGIDVSIEPGKSIALVGESGSGKSTAVTALMRLLPKTAVITGEVHFKGRDLVGLPHKQVRKIRGREISMIFQNPKMYLNPTKTIGQQIIDPLLYHHMASFNEAKDKAINLLTQIGIPDAEYRFKSYPFEFSGGMLQRVMIGMALITNPDLLIADEPTTALDVTVQAEILALLKKMQRDRQMSMIFVTHDLAVAAQIADEIYVMYGGLIMEHVPSAQLIQNQAHPYLQGLLQSIPRIDGRRTELPYIAGTPINTLKALPDGCVFADRCLARFSKCSTRPSLEKIDVNHEVACWRSVKEA
ncbi:ABC transporter ATP-binding protein [Alicyclobacillus dauci]|uniref:ABC transporter ATP-binding protein n=1 Tax=Alicyclobacillus dauci TaxID=1475485 RepID=A0ABY6YZ47_9BACL|nr:ABC transporter ATP-binding protein [Alicyclobacillus dauci]WAH35578.1 ABC transporter ATP-binding protein [Alicyclobacillus dauci]